MRRSKSLHSSPSLSPSSTANLLSGTIYGYSARATQLSMNFSISRLFRLPADKTIFAPTWVCVNTYFHSIYQNITQVVANTMHKKLRPPAILCAIMPVVTQEKLLALSEVARRLPDSIIRAEFKRRFTRGQAGRPPVVGACRHCGEMMSARERRAHEPHCKAKEPR
jgi:hypothetical protein